ncbi:MAG: hypothetical protein LBC35_06200 [Coriobacteriales bacterium]|jgi:hypothetical protein|nr:hypothetical protein [Coriobacteriales bacterium]
MVYLRNEQTMYLGENTYTIDGKELTTYAFLIPNIDNKQPLTIRVSPDHVDYLPPLYVMTTADFHLFVVGKNLKLEFCVGSEAV